MPRQPRRTPSWKQLLDAFDASEGFHQVLIARWENLTKAEIRRLLLDRIEEELRMLRRCGRRPE